MIERGYALLERGARTGSRVKASAFVYPWDVVGDPDAAGPYRRTSACGR